MLRAPLPSDSAAMAESPDVHSKLHPGLVLTRYARTLKGNIVEEDQMQYVQRPTLDALCKATKGLSSQLDFGQLRAQHEAAIRLSAAAQCSSFEARLLKPLALHLSRATALENAGICLHPTYGFVYLPGAGLKGLARAYALEHWLPNQADQGAAWKQVLQVFGYADSLDFKDLVKRLQLRDGIDYRALLPDESAGQIIFHDAWPATVPQIEVDLLNNHHTKYYANGDPPGDWENPVIVTFPTIRAGTFTCHLSGFRHDTTPELLKLAELLLCGGLSLMGFGAKTSSGYGRFGFIDTTKPKGVASRNHRRVLEATLKLVSPAFLAGATQDATDCELTGKTLRGQLRWWWRTMHAGDMSAKSLRDLEAAIWGSASRGGAVDVVLEVKKTISVRSFNFKDGWRLKQEIRDEFDLADPPTLTTQGLLYLAFGMDDTRAGRRLTRHFVEPGAEWEIQLIVRQGELCWTETTGQGEKKRKHLIHADTVAAEVAHALALLCRFGGVGAKTRKGFGSLAADTLKINGIKYDAFGALTVPACTRLAEEFRNALPEGFRAQMGSTQRGAVPTLSTAICCADLFTTSTPAEPIVLIDAVGFAYQQFAKDRKHNKLKKTMGLPRNIHGPKETRANHQIRELFQPPEQLFTLIDGLRVVRFASPLHLSLARSTDDRLTLRAIAFPSAFLIDEPTCRAEMQNLLDHLADAVPCWYSRKPALAPDPPPPPAGYANPKIKSSAEPAPKLPKPPPRKAGFKTKVKIIGPRPNGKPGYLVQEDGQKQGMLVTHAPQGLQSGQILDVELEETNPDRPTYRWPKKQ